MTRRCRSCSVRSCSSRAQRCREHSRRPWHSERNMSKRLLLPVPLVLLALAPAAAQAQTATSPTTPVTPKPESAKGKASLSVDGGLATRKTHYFAPSQEVVVRGAVKPHIRGEVLTLYAIRRGKASKQVRRSVDRRGRYEFRFKVGNPGAVRLVVKHRRSDRLGAFRTRSETVQVVNWQAGGGARGVKVLLLQRGLLKLGFATPVTGYFDGLTANAVNVFRKTNGMHSVRLPEDVDGIRGQPVEIAGDRGREPELPEAALQQQHLDSAGAPARLPVDDLDRLAARPEGAQPVAAPVLHHEPDRARVPDLEAELVPAPPADRAADLLAGLAAPDRVQR